MCVAWAQAALKDKFDFEVNDVVDQGDFMQLIVADTAAGSIKAVTDFLLRYDPDGPMPRTYYDKALKVWEIVSTY